MELSESVSLPSTSDSTSIKLGRYHLDGAERELFCLLYIRELTVTAHPTHHSVCAAIQAINEDAITGCQDIFGDDTIAQTFHSCRLRPSVPSSVFGILAPVEFNQASPRLQCTGNLPARLHN